MRTTLTLEDDVAALLKRLLKARDASLKQLVNEALRRGLRSLSAPPQERSPFVVEPLRSGPCLLPNVDCVGEVLELIEGENYK